MKKYSTHLKVGDKAPIIEGKEQSGLLLNSLDLLELGKLVVVFYRGVWCPFCNEHLKQIETEFLKLLSKNAQILLVTPEQPPFLNKSILLSDAHYPIISDDNYEIMNSFGVSVEVTEENFKDFFIKKSMIEVIKDHNRDYDNLILPIPATFLISQSNVIEYIHYNMDFKNRISVNDVIKKL